MTMQCQTCGAPHASGVTCNPCHKATIRACLRSPAWRRSAAARTGDRPGESLLATFQRLALASLLILAAACGNEAPPLSSADAAMLCLNQTASEYVVCPSDVQLCWHLTIDAPQICPDDGTDGGPDVVLADAGVPLDQGAPAGDAGPDPRPDAGAPEDDGGLLPSPDAFAPHLDPDLEVWPLGPTCDDPGVLLTGGVLCAFAENRLEGGVRVSPVATGAYGNPIGDPCTPNTRPEGDHGDCRAPGVCFAGVCTRPCELGVDECTGTPFAGCEPVGHDTHGVCWGER